MAWGDPLFVYFIRPVGALGPVKIGCSRSPPMRLEQLAEWSPVPLEVVARMSGDFTIEGRLHRKFQHDFMHHEWFRWSAELEEVIASVRAGTFDTSTLPDRGMSYGTTEAYEFRGIMTAASRYRIDFPHTPEIDRALYAVGQRRRHSLTAQELAKHRAVLDAYVERCRAHRRLEGRGPRRKVAA